MGVKHHEVRFSSEMRRRHHYNSDSDDDEHARGPRLLSAYESRHAPSSNDNIPSALPPAASIPRSQPSGAPQDSTTVALEALEPLSALLKDALSGVDEHVLKAFHQAMHAEVGTELQGNDEVPAAAEDDLEMLSDEEFEHHCESTQLEMDDEYHSLLRLVDQRMSYMSERRHAWNVHKERLGDETAGSLEVRASLEKELHAVQTECAALKAAVNEQRQYLERIHKRSTAEEEFLVQEINHLRYKLRQREGSSHSAKVDGGGRE